MRALAIVVGSLLAASASAETMNLVCEGGGRSNRVETAESVVSDTGGSEVGSISTAASVSDPYSSGMEVKLTSEGGLLRLPRAMRPLLHGGSDGWFRIDGLAVGDDQITGRVAVNFMNRPELRIDRHTGIAHLDGKSGHFAGMCRSRAEMKERAF